MIMPHFFTRPFIPALCAALLLLTGCASLQGNIPETTDARSKVVSYAVAQISTAYRFEGEDRTGFDDSGLVAFCYREAGYRLPREHEGQIKTGQPIRFAQAQPGDILFYRYDDGSNDKLHSGIYLGNGQMVHASLKRDEVVNEVIDNPFWFQRLVAVIKILP